MKKESIAAQTVMAALIKRANPMIKKVSDLQIKDADDYAFAALLISNLKQMAKQAAEEKDTIVAPIKKALAAVDAHFKPFLDQVKAIEVDTKAKMIAFIETRDKKSAQLLEQFEAGKIKNLETLVTKQAELNDLDNSSAQMRKVKDVEVYAPKKIPAKYLTPDLTAIKKDLLAGKQIAGARLIMKTSIAI